MATFETDDLPAAISGDPVTEIRKLLDEWRKALTTRDLDGLLKHYDADVRFFDAVPPHEHRGAEAYRQSWEHMMPFLPQSLGSDVRDLEITAEGNLAFASCLQRLTNRKTNEAATCGWVRVTICFRRLHDGWKVLHEHVSVPFNPQTGQASFLKDIQG